MEEKMKAVRLIEFNRPLQIQEVPRPTICQDRTKREFSQDINGVVVKLMDCALCHSDIHYSQGSEELDLPLTLGHEAAGRVEEVGDGVKEFKVGDQVVIYNILYCGTCRKCRDGEYNYCVDAKMIGKQVDGCFAEYIKVPKENLIPLPNTISYRAGCLLGCSMPTAYAAYEVAEIKEGNVVAVFGTGRIGLPLVQMAQRRNAFVIAINPSQPKLDMAALLGADLIINSSKEDPEKAIVKYTDGLGARVVFDCTGSRNQAHLEKMINCCSEKFIQITLPSKETYLSLQKMFRRGLHYIPVYGFLPKHVEKLIRLIEHEKFNLDVIFKNSEIIGLDELPQAMENFKNKQKREVAGIVVKQTI